MANSQSTSMILVSLNGNGKNSDVKSSKTIIGEPNDSFDVPRLQPIAEPKLTAKPQPGIDYGQVLTNSLAANASKQYSPTDK